MVDSARAAVGNRLRPRSILVWFALAAFLFWFYDQSAVQLGMAIATSTILGLSEVFAEVYDLRSEVESLGLALVTLLGGVSLFVFGGSNSDFGAATALVLTGGWMALDAGQVLRHHGLTNDESHESRDGHEVYHEYVVRRVDRELRERPMTRRELFDALDANEAAIDRALDTLTDRGLLDREGSELRVSSPSQAGCWRGLVTASPRPSVGSPDHSPSSSRATQPVNPAPNATVPSRWPTASANQQDVADSAARTASTNQRSTGFSLRSSTAR